MNSYESANYFGRVDTVKRKDFYNRIAGEAGDLYRDIVDLKKQYDTGTTEPDQLYSVMRRFYTLYKRFYISIIQLTSEVNGRVDTLFERQIRKERREFVTKLILTKDMVSKDVEMSKLEDMADSLKLLMEDILNSYTFEKATGRISAVL